MENATLAMQPASETIHVEALPYVLNHDYAQIKILSLDCFDTLLWRIVAEPRDVFIALETHPAFKRIGLTATLRAQAESHARELRKLSGATTEVTLRDIYLEYHPALTEEELNALAETELAAEKAVCYAFPPVIELIRRAKRQGIKVILVSDTYFTEAELRLLLASALPKDTLEAIDKIFCSSHYHYSKKAGLFKNVMRELKSNPEDMLHIGDNKIADYTAAKALGLNALHLIQDHEYIHKLQRLHAMAANLINPSIRTTQPLSNPFRGLFALTEFNPNYPAALIGFYSLGPILFSFAQFILEEVEKICSENKVVKVLFLMRDGYLPQLACQALAGKSIGQAVSISRFSAYAASFRNAGDVDRYLLETIKSKRFHDIARQLLLPKKLATAIIDAAEKSETPIETFSSLIHRSDTLRIIIKKSTEYFDRFNQYLKNEIGLTAGDHLVFVDLGYAGTAQRLLSPLFHELNITVEGRYLIALQPSIKESHRAGLLDARTHDNKTLFSILHYISLIEQLCTTNLKSVIDYDKEGNPIQAEVNLSAQQHTKVAAIQSECIRFINQAKYFFNEMHLQLTPCMRQEYVLAELARLIYLPTLPELHYLQSFQFDLNLGTKDIYPLFNPKEGLAGLKRRGLFYIDRHSTQKRAHYPYELRIAGFEPAITFMCNMRFNLDANLDETQPRKELIETKIRQTNQSYSILIEACATHDGYYSLTSEAGDEFTLSLGQRYQWIQIESAELIQRQAFIKQSEANHVISIKDYLFFENIKDHGNGLLECLSPFATVTIPADSSGGEASYIFRLVYRPVVYRL